MDLLRRPPHLYLLIHHSFGVTPYHSIHCRNTLQSCRYILLPTAPCGIVAMRSIPPGALLRGAQADLITGRISTISTWTCRRRPADLDSLKPASDGSQLEAERPLLLITQTSPAHSGAERRRATKSRFYSARVALSSSMASHKRYVFKRNVWSMSAILTRIGL